MTDGPRVPASPDVWEALRRLTPARVALGRTGASLPTREVLRFGHAHALARDAVHAPLDVGAVRAELAALGLAPLEASSAAADRATYLRRPDLGRQLSVPSRDRLVMARADGCDVALAIADGLSATAVHSHAAAVLRALMPAIRARGWQIGPTVLATQARVALGDEIGAALGARMMLMLIGERPGLSAPDSLGAYLTYAPRIGRRDHERNCISNIRSAGLSPVRAADSILWLMAEAFRRGESGVALKDERRDIEVLPRGENPTPA